MNIQELMANEEFMKGLVEVSSSTELEELFKKNELTLEEGLTFKEAYELIKKQDSEELSDINLEDVTGGANYVDVVAGLEGYALGFLYGYAKKVYKSWKK